MTNDNIDIAILRVLDPDATAELEERAKAAPGAPVKLTGKSMLVGSAGGMAAPRRSQFGATETAEARFLEARRQHRIAELAEEMGLIENYGRPAQTMPKTADEVVAEAVRDDERAKKARLRREYNRRYKGKHPHQLALAKAKQNLTTSQAALKNTQRELTIIEAAKRELTQRPGGEREIELREIVDKEAVWAKALRKSLKAIERWERELPALERPTKEVPR